MESIKTITIKDKTYQIQASVDDKGQVISETYQPIGDYAVKSDLTSLATKSQLGAKLDSSTYNSEKANFASKVSTEDVTENTKELQPNKYYIFGEVETLTLTLAAGEEGKLAEYMFEFTSGTTPTTITEIEGIEWKGDTIEANKVYQASISRGIGILIGRAKA